MTDDGDKKDNIQALRDAIDAATHPYVREVLEDAWERLFDEVDDEDEDDDEDD